MTAVATKKFNFEKILECLLAFGISLYVVTGQMFLLMFHQRYLYLYIAQFLFLGILLYMTLKKRVIYIRSFWANLLFASYFFGMTSAIRQMELLYIQAASGVLYQFLVLYFIVAYVEDRIHEERSEEPAVAPKMLSLVLTAMKLITLVHCVYILLQFVVYRFLKINLNEVVFFNFLHIDTSSLLFDMSGVCTGFTFSQPLLSPMYIMGMVLFTNPFIRLIIIAAAMICRSSTSVGGVGFCVLLLIIAAAADGKLKPSYVKAWAAKMPLWQKITAAVLIAGIIVFVFVSDMDETIYHEIRYLFERVFGASKGGQHFDYFRHLPTIIPQMSSYQKLFGYGNNCSGYPMKVLLGYTTFPEAAIVECDLIDTLLSRGFFGFIVTYGLLICIGIKGYKTDKRYTIVILCYLLMAIGYNIQWHYMLFFVLLLIACIEEKVDLFRVADNVFTLKKNS